MIANYLFSLFLLLPQPAYRLLEKYSPNAMRRGCLKKVFLEKHPSCRAFFKLESKFIQTSLIICKDRLEFSPPV
jgi:hypothetical protein